ncbi:MAG: hypothetical protein GXY33_14735 [Phycisphaerae bacterium]|nr:hypothetical protein [Phycisphaerae bacterium]
MAVRLFLKVMTIAAVCAFFLPFTEVFVPVPVSVKHFLKVEVLFLAIMGLSAAWGIVTLMVLKGGQLSEFRQGIVVLAVLLLVGPSAGRTLPPYLHISQTLSAVLYYGLLLLVVVAVAVNYRQRHKQAVVSAVTRDDEKCQ